MENSSQLLDQGFVEENKSFNVNAHIASQGKRLGNFIIDQIIFRIIIYGSGFLVAMVDEPSEEFGIMFGLFLIFFWIAYYALFEAFAGRTPAKFITGCKVVNVDGSPISIGQAFGRAFCRLIPFEVFSFLGHRGVGWHDSIPNTRVIDS